MLKIRTLVLVAVGAISAVLLAPVASARVAAPRDATHEVVCSCTCGADPQTFEWDPGDDCADYNDITCTDSAGTDRTLTGCVAKSQPVTPAATLEPPTRPGIGQLLLDLP